MAHEFVLILDFGGQLNQLLARRVRDLGVYCEVHPHTFSVESIKDKKPIGIIFTGGGGAIKENSPNIPKDIFALGIPVLGIDYGAGLVLSHNGCSIGEVEKVESTVNNSILNGLGIVRQGGDVYVNENKQVLSLAEGFIKTSDYSVENLDKSLFALQFYPEFSATQGGTDVIKKFLFDICKASGDWSMAAYAETAIADIQEQVGTGKVLLALSGGVDSSVVAALLEKAIGSQLTCIFVDHGLMRKNEGDEVEKVFGSGNLSFIRVNAEERFLARLKSVTDPESKRKIIGKNLYVFLKKNLKKLARSIISPKARYIQIL